MENLILNQNEIIEAIKKLGINFSKDGAERKSATDYFKRKRETLESYWREFEQNHVELSKYNIREEPYHINGDFERTMSLYKSLKSSISKQQEEYLGSSKSPAVQHKAQVTLQQAASDENQWRATKEKQQHQAGDSSQQQVSRGISSRLDDMLRKQFVNFRAFSRTVANIDIEGITERWEFEDTLRNLESRWSTVDTLHWEIEAELNGDDESYQGTFLTHEETFSNLKRAISRKMWAVSHREKSTPVMEIPIFTGSYNLWTSFKDLFYEAVHNNPSLPSAQKMQFLKSKLKGEAESLIRHIPVSSDNYSTCWEILNNRYNNRKLIFTSHMNNLLSVPNIQHQAMVPIKKLHDVILENLHAIKNLGVDISTWDPILVHLLCQKLDSDTHTDYIQSLKNPRELPELSDFIKYLEFKFTSLEASRRKQEPSIPKQSVSKSNNNTLNYSRTSNNYPQKHFYTSYNNNITKPTCSGSGIKCLLCNNTDHVLYQCKNFLNMPSGIKLKTVKQFNICKNCLFDHNGKECFSVKRCRNCNSNHHTLLHDAYLQAQPSTSGMERHKQVSGTTHVTQGDATQVLLATALIRITAADGSRHVMRALIDQGSQISLITENAAQMLGIKRKGCCGVVFGVGGKQNNSKGAINIECSSIYNNFTFTTEVLIMNSLIKNLPTESFSKPEWPHLNGIQLADPEFNTSRRVDLLFGANIYSQIILGGILRGDRDGQPIVQQTHLGWILCGNITKSFHCNVILNNISDIKRFWEIEEIEDDLDITSEDQECVQFYKATTERQLDGRYIVRLPMRKEELHTLGFSKNIAIAQFQSLEKKLHKQKELAKQYKAFIAEYRNLGHMNESSDQEVTSPHCYLPHHCVQHQGDDKTGKFRVVFNASARTSTGVTLNDVMLRGPNLQKDLQSLIIRWRQYKFVVTADIEKMYRQILVHRDDQIYQKIIWRDSFNEQIKSYQLATVTYGLKAAPFLAMMTLRQLAEDEQAHFPKAAKILENDFFMDDLLKGFHSFEDGETLVSELISLLQNGGFTLRKWASNCEQLLKNLSDDQKRETNHFNFKSESTKALGLSWNVKEDKFIFKRQMTSEKATKPTKRVVLSEISKIFDPLGWLSPVVINLKLLFQSIWKANLNWDDPVPDEFFSEYTKLIMDSHNIEHCQVPRWIGSYERACIQLHGFCDASMRAYACVVYARVQRGNETSVVLVAAKTKLVPQSKEITLPRLELSGAQLLSRLMKKIIENLPSYEIKIFGWCDSKVVLGWIQGDPRRWKPFISNRVKLITAIIPTHCWSYVKSSENPADCASRGQLASLLRENNVWWEGPPWLKLSELKQEQITFETSEETRAKQINIVQTDTEPNIMTKLLLKYSSITKVISIVGWILRVFNNKRKQLPTYLTLQELHKAQLLIVKQTQAEEFSDDIKYLRKHNMVKSDSKLLNLNPFIDQDGILRIRGRLEKSHLKLETKHPIILPHDSRMTNLLIDEAHKQTFHGGARLTATWLRQKYWIVGGNRAVKKRIRNCVICRKLNPEHQHQLMGSLPESRIVEAPPFFHTGVDLTGFVDIKANRGRGIKTTKGYIVLFICMVTKAVHVELVSDLSSAAFLSALRRMAARRGAPHHVYSDNGTNFVKGNRNLQEEYFELQQILDNDFLKEVTNMNIEWHFQAPSWPSASGLWERAIRSLKRHLKPVIGEQKLTFEEYTTLLAQVEACLNSRPLCALTEDPEDLDVLTPAHFLTSRADLTIIETDKDARTRWQLVRKLSNDIWKRWKAEYLTQLTVRGKWFKRKQNISIGDIVCIHEDHLPPGKWSMGRVVELHPGSDEIVRVVTLKTKNGLMKRPVLKLSILPIQSEQKKQSPENLAATTISTTKSKHKPYNLIKILYSIILFMNVLTTAQTEFAVNQFNRTQGIYFDKISNLQAIRDEWKLVVYYEMDPFWQGCFALQKYIKRLEQMCTNLNHTSYCNVLSTQLRHSFSELQHYNQMLLTQHESARPRRRRGLINGVGYASNYLFGVLDERFAEQYQRDIAQIQVNQKHLANLWKNQTSIVESEYNLLKRTEESMTKQHDSIHENLRNLEEALKNVGSNTNLNSISNDFNLEALTASNALHNLREIQDALLDQIIDIYNGRFNFHLITPEQLLHELRVISTQLPSDLNLPIENVHSDLRKIYSLLHFRTRMTKEYLLFEIRIPLISRDTYELYKLIPIPQQANNNMMFNLILKSEHIAINLRGDTYITITTQEINKCIHHESDTYLCYLQSPIYQLRSDNDLCISADETRTTCRVEQSSCNNKWVNMHTINTYMYFCCDACTARVHCGMDRVTSYQLARAGRIVTSSDCMIKFDDSLIYPHQLIQPGVLHVRPDVIIKDIAPINHIFNLSIPLLDMNDSDAKNRKIDLVNIDKSIQQMKQEAQLSEMSVHDIHHYAAIYSLLAVVSIACAIIAWRRVRRRWSVPSQTIIEQPATGRTNQDEGTTENFTTESEV